MPSESEKEGRVAARCGGKLPASEKKSVTGENRRHIHMQQKASVPGS